MTETRTRRRFLVAGLVALLTLPLVMALIELHAPKWYPLADLAQTELRVRDVGTSHSPTIGLAGRLGTLANQGSHPGPLSFWSLAPVYRLMGATSFAMQTAAVSLHVVAAALVLWIARRRGGLGLTLAMAAMLAVLIRGYGTSILTEAWNPYLPVLWWLVFVLAVWSVVSRDVKLLPVAVVAGSFCMQTHLPYLGVAGGMFAAAMLVLAVDTYRRRREPGAVREVVRWTALAAGVGIVLWILPVIEQLTHDRGNLWVVWHELTNPPEEPVGLRRGVELMLVHLNPWTLLARRPRATTGAIWPGVLLLLSWTAGVGVAWRLRHRALLRLDLVLAFALVLGTVAMTRIHGLVWYYLVLWAWGINALLVLTIGWSAILLASRRVADPRRQMLERAGAGALALVTVVFVVLFAVDAQEAEVPEAGRSRAVARLVPSTVAALNHDDRYLVTWADPIAIGSQGYGLFNELDRRGFDVGVPRVHGPGAARHRVFDPGEATAHVHLAVGPEIDKARGAPGARQVAYVDARSAAQRLEYQQLRVRVIDELRAVDRLELIADVDSNLFTTIFDVTLPEPARQLMVRMLEIGQPVAVFLGPAPQ
jgi:hypothetical protein